jgi:hypothetical protein
LTYTERCVNMLEPSLARGDEINVDNSYL